MVLGIEPVAYLTELCPQNLLCLLYFEAEAQTGFDCAVLLPHPQVALVSVLYLYFIFHLSKGLCKLYVFPPQVLRVRTPTSPSCSGHPVNCVWPAIMNSMDSNLCGT